MQLFDVDDLAERLRTIGEGSDFRYETAALPWTDDELRAMLSGAEASRAAIIDRMSDSVKHGPLGGKMADIFRSEEEIFASVRAILGSPQRPDISDVLVASALMTVRSINAYLETSLPTEGSESVESDLAEYCDRLEGHIHTLTDLAHREPVPDTP